MNVVTPLPTPNRRYCTCSSTSRNSPVELLIADSFPWHILCSYTSQQLGFLRQQKQWEPHSTDFIRSYLADESMSDFLIIPVGWLEIPALCPIAFITVTYQEKTRWYQWSRSLCHCEACTLLITRGNSMAWTWQHAFKPPTEYLKAPGSERIWNHS